MGRRRKPRRWVRRPPGESDEAVHVSQSEADTSGSAVAMPSMLEAVDGFATMEPELLAMVFSSCSIDTLLRLEVALGRCCHCVRAASRYRVLWSMLLASECGLQLAGLMDSAPAVGLDALKHAARLTKRYIPSPRGWADLQPAELVKLAKWLGTLDVTMEDGREIRNPETGVLLGHTRRLALAHWDVEGVFGCDRWNRILGAFRTRRPLLPPVLWSALSQSCKLGSVCPGVELALRLGPSSVLDEDGPEAGISFGLYVPGLAATLSEQPHGSMLHAALFARCGGIERRSGHVLKYYDGFGLVEVSSRPLWRLAPMPNLGVALSIEVEMPGQDGAFVIDEDIIDASWNRTLRLEEHMSQRPLVWPGEGNAFLAEPPEDGVFQGAIALVRRGGGCGFARKALAAQRAGAVGCIVYEAPGDRQRLGRLGQMGTRFGGVDYENPDIPCVLAGSAMSARLLDAVSGVQGARARLRFEARAEALRRPPQSFNAFCQAAAKGEPVRAALLLEYVASLKTPMASTPPREGEMMSVDWLQEPASEVVDPSNLSYAEIGTMHVATT